MNKLKRFFKKDKYGIVRGCIALCALFVLSSVLFILAQQNRVVLRQGQQVSTATLRAEAQFEQFLAGAESLLDAAVSEIDVKDSPEGEVLGQLAACGFFDEVRIENADGLLTEIIALGNGRGMQIRRPLHSGFELVADVSPDVLHAIFSIELNGPYSYTLYNTNTGVCMLSSEQQQYTNYYDVLLNLAQTGKVCELDENPDAHVRCMRAETKYGSYYVTLAENPASACGISLIVPHETVSHISVPLARTLLTILAPMLLLIAVVVFFTRNTLRRILNSNRNLVRALEMSDQMVSIAARDSRITILVIGYGHEGVLSCHDGLGLTTNTASIRSIADLESACGMSESEMSRVYECMNKLSSSSSAVLTVHCHTANQEDRSLRISFHSVADGSRNILCSISDCTRELASQYIAEQERSYMSNAKRRANSVWQINVSRNRWRSVHIGPNEPLSKLTSQMNVWRDYNADLGGALNEYIHPADYYDFAERASIPGMASAFRSGTTEFTLEYRVCAAQTGDYEWHRLHVRLLTDPKTGDIIANFYIYNVDAKKNAELERGERKRVLQQTLTALSGIYTGLYYVDLDNDLCYTARSRDGEITSQLTAPFKASFDRYIDGQVHPDDRDALQKALSGYALKRTMTEGSHFRHLVYRCLLGDDSYARMSIVIQPARFENGTIKEIALAIREIERETE